MISLNNNSSNEFKILNSTIPEIFRLSAKVQLAETTSFLNPIPIENVELLIQSCLSSLPNHQYHEIKPNDPQIKKSIDTNPTLFSTMISIRSQESVIALSHLYKCSNGVIDERVIPILLSFLMYLTYVPTNTTTTSNSTTTTTTTTTIKTFSQNDIQNTQNFTFYLLNQLSILSHVTVSARDQIVPVFLEFFNHITLSTNQSGDLISSAIYGTFQALGDQTGRFDFRQDELSKLIVLLESFLSNLYQNTKINQKKCLLLICQTFEQITYLPQEVIESDIYKRIYNNVFPYTSSISDNETFISIINVIVRCGILDSSIGKEVLEYLIRFISETKNLTENEASTTLHKPYCEKLYLTILSSFVEMADKFSEKTLRIVEVLKDFLCVSLVVKQSDTIRNGIYDCFCKILKNEYQKERGVDVCRQVVGSLVNTLHTQYSNYSITAAQSQESFRNSRSPSVVSNWSQNDTLANIIICIGKITCSLNDLSITEMILPNFMSRVTYPPGFIENLILEQLTDISLLGHSSITKDIVVLITNLFKKIYKDPNQYLITNITPITLQRLARYLHNQELRQDLCKRVLKLFQQLGKAIRKEEFEQNISSPILKGMGFLLPTIAELIKALPHNTSVGGGVSSSTDKTVVMDESSSSENSGATKNEEVDTTTIKLYRSVWFYCVLFKFSVQGAWRSDWRDCVQVIASHLAPLVSSKPHIYLEMEVELDSIIKQGFEKEYFIQLKNTLFEYFPNHTAFIKNLTFAQTAYIYSVYTLETMRSSISRSFKVVFSYLEDQGIENINVSNCIRAIVDKVFSDFLLNYSNVSPSLIDHELSDHANFLLIKFCYPHEPVRKAADDYISTLVTKFPQVLWSKSCLSTLLDLVEVVGLGAKAKPMDLISITMPNSNVIIELPDDTPSRQRLLQDVVALVNIWLKSGTNAAPVEIQELLQEYMQKFNQLIKNHIGFSLAVEIGSIDSTTDAKGPTTSSTNHTNGSGSPGLYKSNAASFVGSLQLKALYSGEVNGMINMMMMDENENEENENLSEIVEELAFLRLIEEFEKIIQIHKKGQPIDNQTFSSIMYRSCAFLINHYFGQSVKLIHLVCYAPAFIFTPDSMNIGISAWKWLLAERADLTQFIMTSIGDIWSWTVNQRIGLFSNSERDPSPLAISAPSKDSSVPSTFAGASPSAATAATNGSSNSNFTYGPTTSSKNKIDKTNDLPHKIWIHFLEERFSVVKYSSQEQVDIIIGMMQKAISDPNSLSVSPKSLGTRFKLLLLCMKIIQGDHIKDVSCSKLMRERVYLGALSWFYLPPIWYGSSEARDELQSDTKTLIEFCKSLQSEPIFQYLDKRFTIGPFKDKEKMSTSSSSSSTSSGTPLSVGTNSIRNGRPSSERILSTSLNNALDSSLSTSATYANAMANQNSISSSNPNVTTYNNASLRGNPFSFYPKDSASSNGKDYSTGTNTSDLLSIKMDVVGSGVGTMSSANSYLISQSILESIRADKPMPELQTGELRKRRNLILLLVGNELERMSAWNNPINRISLQIPEQLKFSYDNLPKSQKSNWKDYLVSAWKINPKLAIHFGARFQQSKIRRILSEMVVKNTKSVLNIPEALPLLVTEENVKANIPELKYLLYWETVTPPQAISLLGKAYQSHPLVSQYATRVLRNFPPETIMFYIPQLVQALRYDKSGQVENYLVSASKTSELLAHQIIWNLQTYTEVDPNSISRIVDDPSFQSSCKRLKERVVNEMDEKTLQNYKSEFDFFESFTSISGRLLQLKDPTKRKTRLREELKMLTVETGNANSPLYLPTNPKSIVVGLEVDSAITLQSAAKVPILVNFKVIERQLPAALPTLTEIKSPPPSNSPPMGTSITSSSSSLLPNILKNQSPKLSTNTTNIGYLRESSRNLRKGSKKVVPEQQHPTNVVHPQGCIFKSGDDTRQDMLALQVIDLFKRIFNSVGLDLYLFPYKVIATKPGCGIIELCPNTMSRDQIGKKVNGSLYNYFISKYGNKNSVSFQNARRNFIKSMAAYSVVSYILQIKDRHNANILVDEEGHIIHIDFGFIFDISPGGDLLTFEASPFKLSQEMIDIMGGKPNAEQFTWFMEQSVRAFLAARQHMDSIITLVELMLDTHLPCFKDQTLNNLRDRFCPYKPETYAAKFMTKIVMDSFSTLSTFSTYFYDVFQYYDNGIEM
eukprot:gene9672-11857_t